MLQAAAAAAVVAAVIRLTVQPMLAPNTAVTMQSFCICSCCWRFYQHSVGNCWPQVRKVAAQHHHRLIQSKDAAGYADQCSRT